MGRRAALYVPILIFLPGPTKLAGTQLSGLILAVLATGTQVVIADRLIAAGGRLKLTGSEIPLKDIRKFRYKLKKALENLVVMGFFASASIDPRTDLVMVERNRSHLSIVER